MAVFGHEPGRKLPFDSGKLKGKQIDAACQAWFTSKGRIMPLMIKVKDANEEIYVIDKIHVIYMEEKIYSGIPSTEFCCSAIYEGQRHEIKLIYFKETCKWVMAV